jgi:MFS transporter, MHS family, proline/betaine transporter
VALGDSAGGTTPYVVTWLTAETGNKPAPALLRRGGRDRVALTIRETAGRSLSQGVADEMFQSNADIRGAASTG